MFGGFHVGVLDIQVVIAFLDLLDIHLPGEFTFLALVPPFDLGGEFLKRNRPALVVGNYAFRVRVFVIPDGFGRFAFGEEQKVGVDAGVGVKDTLRQAHDGVQVAFGEKLFFDAGFHALAEKGAIGQNNGRPGRRS